jgi:hypothetical protein
MIKRILAQRNIEIHYSKENTKHTEMFVAGAARILSFRDVLEPNPATSEGRL